MEDHASIAHHLPDIKVINNVVLIIVTNNNMVTPMEDVNNANKVTESELTEEDVILSLLLLNVTPTDKSEVLMVQVV